jgi:hypothetical protein
MQIGTLAATYSIFEVSMGSVFLGLATHMLRQLVTESLVLAMATEPVMCSSVFES